MPEPPRAPTAHAVGGVLDVAGLVVEEEVGLELAQELALGQAAEEHRLVDLDVPVHQRADRALVRRRAARGDQRGADAHVLRAVRAAAAAAPRSSGLNGPARQRRGGAGRARAPGRRPARRAGTRARPRRRTAPRRRRRRCAPRPGARRGARRMRVDARRRHAGCQRGAHVGLVGRQEQVARSAAAGSARATRRA